MVPICLLFAQAKLQSMLGSLNFSVSDSEVFSNSTVFHASTNQGFGYIGGGGVTMATRPSIITIDSQLEAKVLFHCIFETIKPRQSIFFELLLFRE
jgi:hypothetical protein